MDNLELTVGVVKGITQITVPSIIYDKYVFELNKYLFGNGTLPNYDEYILDISSLQQNWVIIKQTKDETILQLNASQATFLEIFLVSYQNYFSDDSQKKIANLYKNKKLLKPIYLKIVK